MTLQYICVKMKYDLAVHLYKTEAETYDLTVRLLKYDTVV